METEHIIKIFPGLHSNNFKDNLALNSMPCLLKLKAAQFQLPIVVQILFKFKTQTE